jgi:D-amino-acid dehydrogenase
MTSQKANRSIAALTEISKYSLSEYAKLDQDYGGIFGFERKGLLMIGQTQAGVQSATQEMHCVAEHGIPGKYLSESDIRSMEPALKGPIRGGVYFPEEAHAEPLAVVQTLAKAAIKNGVQIVSSAEVFDFIISDNGPNKKVRSVRTTRGYFEGSQFVLATGSWSQALARNLKINIPILGGKGYSMILNSLDPNPKTPIMVVDKKIAITPRKNGLRIAGTLELVNQDYSINTRRVDAIIRGAQECLNVPANPEIIELWRGLRPCTPDGVPVIGFSKHYPNLLITAGHQMLGLQSAPGSGRLACDLLLGNTPIFDPAPFRSNRF